MTPRIAPLAREERDERTEELLASLRREPGGPDLNLFATLAHHPRLLKRWSGFGGVLLYRGELSARERELLILRTAWNCQAHYEWGQHRVIALACDLTEDDIERVRRGPDDEEWPVTDATLLRAADELHAWSRISDLTWEALSSRYTPAQLIEICMVVGQYHLVAFTLNSLGVELDEGVKGFE
jgi:4-carboxymuconolactone decarboxylase